MENRTKIELALQHVRAMRPDWTIEIGSIGFNGVFLGRTKVDRAGATGYLGDPIQYGNRMGKRCGRHY